MRGELLAPEHYADLASDWTALQTRARCAPFASWMWVSNWLAHLPSSCKPMVFRAQDDAGVLALALLVEVPEGGSGRLFGRRSLLLQESGDADIDEITIEYAGLLVEDGAEASGYAAFFEAVQRLRGDWRRLRISATADAGAIISVLPAGMTASCIADSPAHYVDLAAVRASGRSYRESLGSKVRGSLNQALRGYAALGELRVESAADAVTALAWLDAMSELHTRYWNSKGVPGSFASPFFVRFHRALVAAGSTTGFVRMIRITAGASVVGYLYNLDWQGRVYFYNSGLNYGLLPRHDRPGVVALYLAIEQALGEGWNQFDFLAGTQDYKRRFATSRRELHWIDIRRRSVREAGERLLARISGRATFGIPLAQVLASAAEETSA